MNTGSVKQKRSTSSHHKRFGKSSFSSTNRKPRKGNFLDKKNGRNRSSKNRRGGAKRRQPSFDPSQFINKNPIKIQEEVFTPVNTFLDMGLGEATVDLLKSFGIEKPSPIQDKSISVVLGGRDLVGLAETGTGKTAAFLLPLIKQSHLDNKKQTLILAPTRELALQIYEEFKKLSGGERMFATVCVGGMNIGAQIRGLRRKNHFIIGTPGRVMDLINRKNLKTEHITGVVLDEADRMLDMGFIGDIRSILSSTPKERQTLLFSATMSKQAESLVHEFLKDPEFVSVKKKDVTDSIEQDIISCKNIDKFNTLKDILSSDEFSKVIVFGAMKHSVEKLSQDLSKNNLSAVSIHGNKTHSQRQRALRSFKEGNANVLVATDVAARGIHVDDVTHVINYDLPQTFEDYVHRIGRTGRGVKKGKALTFIAK